MEVNYLRTGVRDGAPMARLLVRIRSTEHAIVTVGLSAAQGEQSNNWKPTALAFQYAIRVPV
jgi:hypothetical protein